MNLKLLNPFQYKAKIAAILFFTFIFSVMLFPTNDIADLLTVKVADATANQVYLESDSVSLNLSPLGFVLEAVNLELDQLPPLTADKVSLIPSISSLLAFKPGFSLGLEGIFKGLLSLSYRAAEKTKSGAPFHFVELDAQNLALLQVLKFVMDAKGGTAPKITGLLSAKLSAKIDQKGDAQPEGQFQINSKSIVVPAETVSALNLGFGGEMKAPSLLVKGSMNDGKLTFDDIQIGSEKDPFSAKIKGNIIANVKMMPDGKMVPDFGGYQFQFDLHIRPEATKDFALLDGFFSAFKSTTPSGGTRYAFRLEDAVIPHAPEEIMGLFGKLKSIQ